MLIIYLFFQFYLQWTDNQYSLFQMVIYQLSSSIDYQIVLGEKIISNLRWDQLNPNLIHSLPELNNFFNEI